MKKFLSILLSVLIVFSLCACSNTKTSSDENSIDIEYFAKLGQVPECEFKIGTSVADINNELSAAESEADDGHSHETFQVIEGEKSVLIDAGHYGYYYLKEKEADGISYIVSYEKAFGFEIGTLSIDVKDALKDFDYTEEAVSEENAFFMFSNSGTVLECSFSDYTLIFVFESDALCATAIYLTEDWQ